MTTTINIEETLDKEQCIAFLDLMRKYKLHGSLKGSISLTTKQIEIIAENGTCFTCWYYKACTMSQKFDNVPCDRWRS